VELAIAINGSDQLPLKNRTSKNAGTGLLGVKVLIELASKADANPEVAALRLTTQDEDHPVIGTAVGLIDTLACPRVFHPFKFCNQAVSLCSISLSNSTGET
jgi:hypothetical protein